MTDIIISKRNESVLHIDCEMGILYELSEHFAFMVEGAKFLPKVKAKMWDGVIKLLDTRFGTLPVGLFNELVTFSKELGYEVEFKDGRYGLPNAVADVKLDEVKEFVSSLNLHSKGNAIEVRDYQIQAIYNCIKNHRQISITPTGGGKSLVAYCLYRWYIAHEQQTFMLVVPSLGLVKQMYADFKDYSSHNGYDVAHNTQIIAEGADKNVGKSLIICTWQSVYKQPSTWFNQLDVIFMDEVHQGKADCIKGIFEKSTEVKYRFGVTGSLDKSAVNKMVLRGMIGEISKVKSTRDLIDEGHLSEIKIECMMLKYNSDSKKLMKTADYKQEIDFLCQHPARNKLIRKLALAQSGVTLLLFNYISHGEELYEEIKKHSTSQICHLVNGKVEAEDRERIRLMVQETDGNHIICASVGTFSTGINLPNISNIIFASPTKSVVRVMQSLGRGLRKAVGKTHLNLYDIVDAINSSKTNMNYTLKHFIERLRIYTEERHQYRIHEIVLE